MSKRTSTDDPNATGERVPTVHRHPVDPANIRMRARALIDPSGCTRIGL